MVSRRSASCSSSMLKRTWRGSTPSGKVTVTGACLPVRCTTTGSTIRRASTRRLALRASAASSGSSSGTSKERNSAKTTSLSATRVEPSAARYETSTPLRRASSPRAKGRVVTARSPGCRGCRAQGCRPSRAGSWLRSSARRWPFPGGRSRASGPFGRARSAGSRASAATARYDSRKAPDTQRCQKVTHVSTHLDLFTFDRDAQLACQAQLGRLAGVVKRPDHPGEVEQRRGA